MAATKKYGDELRERRNEDGRRGEAGPGDQGRVRSSAWRTSWGSRLGTLDSYRPARRGSAADIRGTIDQSEACRPGPTYFGGKTTPTGQQARQART
jgi:hypothetical protein